MASAEARACFEEHGWCVLRGVVPPDRLAGLRALFDQLTAHAPAGRVGQLPNVARAVPALLAHLREGLAATVAELLGCERLRLLQDVLLVKPPGAPAIPWHRDSSYTGYFRPLNVAAVRLSLGDSSVERGCLAVLDGSHRWDLGGGLEVHHDAIPDDVLASFPPHLAATPPTPVPLRAGDVSIHHANTLHMSYANVSDVTRRTVVTHLFDAACRVDRGRFPDPATAAAFPADPDGVPDPQAFPLL